MTLNFILVGIYLILVLFIGWRAGRKETPQDFLIASRNVGFFRTAASAFAVLGGEMLITQAALAYTFGFGAFWFWLGIALGVTLLGFLSGKIKTLSDELGFINISEYFGFKWGSANRSFSAFVIFITFFALLTVQFMAVGNILSPLFNISYPIIVTASGLIVLAYLLMGGYKAVIDTDLLQAILMIGLLVGLVFLIDIGPVNFSQSIFAAGPMTLISFSLIGFFLSFAAADMWQRIFSARSTQVVKNSFFLVAVLFLIFGFSITLIGIAARNHFSAIDPNEAFFWGLSSLLPSWLLGAAVVMVLATIMSTIDTEVFLVASSIAKDFILRKKDGDSSDTKLPKIIGWTMVVLTIISAFIAIFVQDIITVLFALASFGLSIAPAIFCSLFWKLKPRAVFLSMTGGVLTFLTLIILGQFNPDNAVATLPGSLIFLIIGQIIFREPAR